MIKNVEDYLMISDHDVRRFNDEIAHRLETGWLLHGLSYTNIICDGGDNYVVYSQAMILKKK